MGIQRTRSKVPWTPSAWADGAIHMSNVPGSTVGARSLPRNSSWARVSVNVTVSLWPGFSATLRNAFISRTGRVMLATRSWIYSCTSSSHARLPVLVTVADTVILPSHGSVAGTTGAS
ncbi:hypothetical protein WR25_12457 [Diploscapter pachys]|uniref:Uncharacterized protein n=1 Tax=Diploscapter pachys TaxID=2018661 RepID=A0A2A2JYE1_9BILA|nr:hypothetical protein WR25_12457 [Diploscapter pachys]